MRIVLELINSAGEVSTMEYFKEPVDLLEAEKQNGSVKSQKITLASQADDVSFEVTLGKYE